MSEIQGNRRRLRTSVIPVAVLGLTGLGAIAGTAVAQTTTTPAAASAPMKVYDYPYCELIPDTVANGIITEHVFNTLGFNTCPTSSFSTITEQNVVDAYNAAYPPAAEAAPATSATINGRRHWVMDTIQSTGGVTGSTDTLTVNGMELGLKAQLQVAVGAPTVGTVPYVATTVSRDTVYDAVVQPAGEFQAQDEDPALHRPEEPAPNWLEVPVTGADQEPHAHSGGNNSDRERPLPEHVPGESGGEALANLCAAEHPSFGAGAIRAEPGRR
ncbi:MAG: hypothetical protein NT143_07940 [Actinobacteria bacterium]|nr:hypothetical protein [Actinomycetota bacterium]